MAQHDWPGNVRELRNYVERSVVLQSASPRRGGVADARRAGAATGINLDVPFRLAKEAVIDSFERSYLSQLLTLVRRQHEPGRSQGPAMDRMYLHRLVQRHGLYDATKRRPEATGEASSTRAAGSRNRTEREVFAGTRLQTGRDPARLARRKPTEATMKTTPLAFVIVDRPGHRMRRAVGRGARYRRGRA